MPFQTRFSSGDPLQVAGDLLAIPLFDSELGKERPEVVSAAETSLGSLLLKAAAEEGFKGGKDQTFLFHTHGKLKFDRVLLLGLGSRARFEPELLRMAMGRAAKKAYSLKAQELVLVLPDLKEMPELVKAAVEGAGLGGYRFDRYRTTEKKQEKGAPLKTLKLCLPKGASESRELTEAAALGQRITDAANWARDLVNEPACVVTPTALAQAAEKAAKAHGLKATIGGLKEIQRLKMGMFIGVTQGSVEEPRLIQISYVPKSPADAKKPPLALVGKAITFDSGGLSLKTAEGMVDMKTDMAGSAAVLGAMQVIAALKPPFPVHAFVGACENMPSGTAYRPGDVLISKLGKTVEITNTDAEGRLVLGDILAYACEQKPMAVIDLATLTGACIVALGHYIVGAFGDDDQIMWDVLEAARDCGEPMWRLPMSELQREGLRSEIADMKNSGERWGGSISAAMFLKEFVGETPWVHLDIAGPSQSPKDRGYYSKGATGVGVRTLVELVRHKIAEQTAEAPARPARAARRAS